MQNKGLILQSKNILLNRLEGNKEYADKMAYNIFVISAFLLVKENLIKKASNEDTLYFDYINQRKYIKPIQTLATYIIENGDYQRNNTKVKGKNNETVPQEIDEYIWIVNKIRDSLAHAAYTLKEDKIIINNDHTNEIPSYKLKCEIPIKELDKFVLSVLTDKKINRQALFNYISPLLTKKDQGENCTLLFKGGRTLIVKDMPKEINYTHYDGRTHLTFDRENDYNILINENEYNFIQRKFAHAPSIKQNHLLRKIEKSHMRAQILKEQTIKEETIIDDTTNIINTITPYFNSNSIEDIINYIYLYNYMELVFSFIDIENIDLTSLNLNNIEFEIDNENYKTIKDKIIKESNDYKTKLNAAIENYENNYPNVPTTPIEDIYNGFIQKIDRYLKVINIEIIKKIRNGIEHANIQIENDKIKITDKNNQNEDKTNASFTGTIENWLDITQYIENPNITNDFDISALKSFLENEDYINLTQTLQRTKEIIEPQKQKTLTKQNVI